MKPKIEKVAGIPITVLHRATPCIWELKPNPQGVYRTRDPAGPPLCFVAREVEVPLVIEWKGIKLPGPPPAPTDSNGVMLRERFMELRTDEEFLDFLNQYGRFSPLKAAEDLRGWQMRDFTGCQKLFAELARRSPKTWKEYIETLVSPHSFIGFGMLNAVNLSARHTVTFHWNGIPKIDYGAKHFAVIETRDVVSAILATIEIDHLRGAKFGACARTDCPKFFEITSQHKRKYCTMSCAHLESVRRMRKRQKAKRLKSGTKERVRRGRT